MEMNTSKNNSALVFVFITVASIFMAIIMHYAMKASQSNTKINYEAIFAELKSEIINFHKLEDDATNAKVPLPSPQDAEKLLQRLNQSIQERFTNYKFNFIPYANYTPTKVDIHEFNGRHLLLMRFASPENAITVAMTPLSKRHIPKTGAYSYNGLLFFSYQWDEFQSEGTPSIQTLATNILNDYFIFLIGDENPKELADWLYNSLDILKPQLSGKQPLKKRAYQ